MVWLCNTRQGTHSILKGIRRSLLLHPIYNYDLWHMRLGHVNFRKLEDMMKSNLIPNLDKNFDSCTTCMLTKITRQHFKSIKRSSRVLDLIY